MRAWGLVLVVVCVACSRSPYAGYKRVGDDVYLRMHVLGDGEHLAADMDSVLFRLRFAPINEAPGSHLSLERWYLARDLRREAFVPMLARMRQGDSISMIVRAGALPWDLMHGATALPDSTTMQVEAGMLELLTAEVIAERAERRRRTDPQGYERRLIALYREQEGGAWTRWGTSDMCYRISGTARDTSGQRPGDLVTIGYTGKRLEDGRVFDDSDRNGMPLQFRFGDPDQVVRGVELAVDLLREGQEGEFILPSELAYGAKGIPGVVDPYSPVIYTVRLLRVGRAGDRSP